MSVDKNITHTPSDEITKFYVKVLIQFLNDLDSRCAGWGRIRQTIVEEKLKNKHLELNYFGPPDSLTMGSKISEAWLQARVLGKLGRFWCHKKVCEGFTGLDGNLFGGGEVLQIIVNIWEGNLTSMITGATHGLCIYSIMHPKSPKNYTLWDRLIGSGKPLPYLKVPTPTPSSKIYEDGKYEWLSMIVPSVFSNFKENRSGTAYRLENSKFLTKVETTLGYVEVSTEKFDYESGQVLMALQIPAISVNSVMLSNARKVNLLFEELLINPPLK